jgi:hypothetical protein
VTRVYADGEVEVTYPNGVFATFHEGRLRPAPLAPLYDDDHQNSSDEPSSSHFGGERAVCVHVPPYGRAAVACHVAVHATALYLYPSRGPATSATTVAMNPAWPSRALVAAARLGARLSVAPITDTSSSRVVRSLEEAPYWEDTLSDVVQAARHRATAAAMQAAAAAAASEGVESAAVGVAGFQSEPLASRSVAEGSVDRAEVAVETTFTRPSAGDGSNLHVGLGLEVVDIRVAPSLVLESHCPRSLDVAWGLGKAKKRLRLRPRSTTALFEGRRRDTALRFEAVPDDGEGSDLGLTRTVEAAAGSELQYTNAWSVSLLEIGLPLSLRMRGGRSGDVPLQLQLHLRSARTDANTLGATTERLNGGLERYGGGSGGGLETHVTEATTVMVRVCVPCVVVDRSGLGLAFKQPSTGLTWPQPAPAPRLDRPSYRDRILSWSSHSSSASSSSTWTFYALVPEGAGGVVEVVCGARRGVVAVRTMIDADSVGASGGGEYAHRALLLPRPTPSATPFVAPPPPGAAVLTKASPLVTSPTAALSPSSP